MMLYLQLFWVYIQIGLFGFGGGYAMLPLIHDEVVTKYGWLTSEQFTDVVALSQVTPGPIGINSATYIGYVVTGSVWGSLLATFAISLPSFILVMLISIYFNRFRQNKFVDAAFTGIRPASVGLIASAALLLTFNPAFINILRAGGRALEYNDVMQTGNFPDVRSIVIFLIVFAITLTKKVHPILLIFLSGLIGLVIF